MGSLKAIINILFFSWVDKVPSLLFSHQSPQRLKHDRNIIGGINETAIYA